MKKEPTATTETVIYKIMDLELKDLDIEPGADAFRNTRTATEYAQIIAAALLDEYCAMSNAITAAENDTNAATLHRNFTDIFRSAISAAGRAVRLAAIARLGIIRSETMAKIDRIEQ